MCEDSILRPKIVAGNWKMNGDSAFISSYCRALESELKKEPAVKLKQVKVFLLPPSIMLADLRNQLKAVRGLEIQLGAQNSAAYLAGAYTGEVSVSMLEDYACHVCLVGHSERRALFSESDDVVVEKIRQLLTTGIKPVLCLGETLEQREAGYAEQTVCTQLQAVLDAFDEQALQALIIAYEPVWAIGTGKTATPQQAQDMHAYIRSVVSGKSAELAETMPILYGGSVNAENARELFAQSDIDGALVGGASLQAESFLSICRQCEESIS